MTASFRLSPSRSRRRGAAAFGGAAALMTLLVSSAWATPNSAVATVVPTHARLDAVVPKDGSSVDSPTEVRLTFNERVNADFVMVTVVGPRGSIVGGDPEVQGRVVRQPLTEDQAPGRYTVTYRVVSTDGHPISGTSTFASLATASPASSPSPTAPSTVPPVSPVPSNSVRHTSVETSRYEGVPDIVLLTLAAIAVIALVLGGVAVARRRIHE